MSEGPTTYIFPHVPKCAGSSVLNFLMDRLPSDEVVIIYSRSERKTWEEPRQKVPQARRDKIRVLYGHRLPQKAQDGFAGRDVRQIGMLRDPISLKISIYNYLQKQPVVYGVDGLSFERWYARSKHNSLSRFYLKSYFGLSSGSMRLMSQRRRFEFLSSQFNNFWFVGDYRNCDEVTEAMAGDLGVPFETLGHANTAESGDVSAKDISPSLRQRIIEDNALDLAVYNAWAERRWQGKPLLEAGDSLTKRWTWQ